MAYENEGKITDNFAPVAKYYSAMDMVLFIREDCSYRADRVDMFLTVLWHPSEQRLVGIKLKGVRFLFERLKVVLGLEESHFVPLIKVIEMALVGGMTESVLAGVAQERVQDLYGKAREIGQNVELPPEEWKRALAACDASTLHFACNWARSWLRGNLGHYPNWRPY